MITVKEFEEIKERLITETVASLQQLGTQFGIEIGTRDVMHYLSVAEYSYRVGRARQSIYKRMRVGTLPYIEVESAPTDRPIQLVRAVPRRKGDNRAIVLQERYLVNNKENEKE